MSDREREVLRVAALCERLFLNDPSPQIILSAEACLTVPEGGWGDLPERLRQLEPHPLHPRRRRQRNEKAMSDITFAFILGFVIGAVFGFVVTAIALVFQR